MIRPAALNDFGFFVLRTPARPLQDLIPLSSLPFGEIQPLLERLLAFFEGSRSREALYLASSSLFERISGNVSPSLDPKKRQKLALSLAKYASRMCTRATPFGLFASLSTGGINASTSLELSAASECRRHTRLDSGVVFNWVDRITRTAASAEHPITWSTNSTLFKEGEFWRYCERDAATGTASYRLSTINDDEAIGAVLARAAGGASLSELEQALHLLDDTLEQDEVSSYLDELVSNGVLRPEIEPPITGAEPLHYLCHKLHVNAHSNPSLLTLHNVSEMLSTLDAAGDHNVWGKYSAITNGLKAIDITEQPSRLFQVDMVNPALRLTLGKRVVEEILNSVDALLSIRDHLKTFQLPELERFNQRFTERFGTEWLPLLKVLDPETGLGFGGSGNEGTLLREIDFPSAAVNLEECTKAWEHLMLGKVSEAWRRGTDEIVLTDEDLESLGNPTSLKSGNTFSVWFNLIAQSSDAIDAGDYSVVLHSVDPRSAVSLIARFCHADEELLRRVREITEFEQAASPESLLAEICHRPDDSRSVNVVHRPVLRRYEIPCEGRTGVDAPAQLPLSDLLVSVRHNKTLVRSRRYGKLVAPKLATAHNYALSRFPAYRFLAMVGDQEGHAFAFKWPTILHSADFLPRVRFRKMILSPAQWRIPKSMRRLVGRSDLTSTEFVEICEQLKIPRHVDIRKRDQALTCDLKSTMGMSLAKDLLHKDPELALSESFVGSGSCVRGPDGDFFNEIILPAAVANREAQTGLDGSRGGSSLLVPSSQDSGAYAGRTMFPGSSWSYAKLYCGRAHIDDILCRYVRPQASEFKTCGLVDRWHFVRYHDPEWHVRVRLRALNSVSARDLHIRVADLLRELSDRQLIWRGQLDTYDREIDRYGGPTGIDACEELFDADSECAIALIEQLTGAKDDSLRWRAALLGIHTLLCDFGFDLQSRSALAKERASTFASEFAHGAAQRKQLSQSFREVRRDLVSSVLSYDSGHREVNGTWKALSIRSERSRASIAALRSANDQGRLTRPLHDIARSLVHMWVNRIIGERPREHEFVLYDYLHRIYQAAEKDPAFAEG